MKRLVASAVAVLTALVVPPAGAGASGRPGTQLDCTFGVELAFDPGISPEPEWIRITSAAPGVLSCQGTWAGHALTGHGVMVFEGDAVGSCAGSTVDGLVRMDHPLASGGRMQIDVPFRSGRLGMAMYGEGGDPDRPASLVATGTPGAGQDCRRVPITRITAAGRAVFGPWR